MNPYLIRTAFSRIVALLFLTLCPLLSAQELSETPVPLPPVEAHPPIHILPLISTTPIGYSPAKMRHAYGFDVVSGTGAGQTIAIVEAYGSSTIQSDLNKFCTTFGLPTTTLSIYYPQGVPAPNTVWALETSLDVEWAHAIATGAKIALVVAKSPVSTDLLAAVDFAVSLGAKQVSMSWATPEFSGVTYYDYHFNKPGVTFTSSAGDSGAAVMWPACSQYVVGVGGTHLVLDANGNVTSETGWSGSGGGISLYVSKPVFQNGWQTATKRTAPDVSYNADPATGVSVYMSNYYGQTGWLMCGGTSAGAPQWAALAALVNASRAVSMSSANTLLYGAGNSNYAGNYRDIVSGYNGKYYAVARYDYVTGLGSPRANSLVPYLRTH
jgi:subtilase family serine protease